MTSPSSLFAGPMGAVAQMMFSQPEQRAAIAKDLAQYLYNAGIGEIGFQSTADAEGDYVDWETSANAAVLLVNELAAAMGVTLPSGDATALRLSDIFGRREPLS